MFNTYPDVATLDHARYDVQLVACDRSAEEKIAPVLPVIRVEEPVAGKDDEAPKDDASDPYFVKGVGQQTTVTPADAEAIVEAALRPTMRFVEPKSADQQARAVAAALSTRPNQMVACS